MWHDVPWLKALLASVPLALLGGCQTLADLGNALPTERAAPAASTAQASAAVARLLLAMQQQAQGSAAEQAEQLSAARLAWEQGKRPPATLRYGLLLSVPGHTARDPQLARSLLREALAAPEYLSGVERALATIELQRLELELRQGEENQRLVQSLQQEREANSLAATVASRRLRAEIEDSAKLRKALDEARAKLDAIASIERGMSQRNAPAEGRKP